MESLLGGWGCAVLKAQDLETALTVIAQHPVKPDALLIDYHLDDSDGIEIIGQLRHRFGADLTGILITADRSPRVRTDARINNIHVLHKPLKPAALRALLMQHCILRVAAE